MKEIRTIMDLGIPTHIRGYEYINEAINIIHGDITTIHHVIKEIYIPIAKKYNATPSRVERCIRFAIQTAFNNMSPDDILNAFGNSLSFEKDTPTNAQFLSTVAILLNK